MRILRHLVPLLFLALCIFGIVVAKITAPFLLSEMLVRMSRNSVLVLALLIPILAGLGLAALYSAGQLALWERELGGRLYLERGRAGRIFLAPRAQA